MIRPGPTVKAEAGRDARSRRVGFLADWIVVAVLTAAGAALRFTGLAGAEPWWDEFVTLCRAVLPPADLLASLSFVGPSEAGLDSSPPLYHLLAHASLALFRSDLGLKLPSLVFGSLTPPLVYLVGRRLLSPRAGLVGAALCAFSLFHIHYSQEARPYALYLFLALWSLYFTARLASGGRAGDYAGFVLSSLLMFYASYLATATFLAEAVFLGGAYALARFRSGRPGGARPSGPDPLRTLAAMAAVLAGYAAWIPGHRHQVLTIYAPAAPKDYGLDFALGIFKSFTAYFYQGDYPYAPIHLAALALGLVAALAARRRAGLILLWLWSTAALVMALALPTEIKIHVRYLINLYVLITLLCGAGVAAAAVWLGRLAPRPLAGAAGAVLAVLMATALSWPSIRALPIARKGGAESVKAVLAGLARERPDVDSLFFYRNRHLKVMSRFSLGERYRLAGTMPDRAYRRVLYLTREGLGAPRGLGGAMSQRVTFMAEAFVGGIVNRAPPWLDAGPYEDDFSGLDFHRDVFSADNLAPDLEYGTLALFDLDRPGEAVYALALPDGAEAGEVALEADFVLRRGPVRPPEARIEIAAGTDHKALAILDEITAEDFRDPEARGGHAGEISRSWSIPAPPEGGRVFVRFRFEAGLVDGYLELSRLRLAATAPRLPRDAPPLWARTVRAIAANTPLTAWRPKLGVADGRPLFAFADPTPEGTTADTGATGVPIGGPDDHRAFLAEHPGARPVFTLPQTGGGPGIAIYDPGLDDPFLTVGGRARPVLTEGRPVRGLLVKGPMDRQRLVLGRAGLDIPLSGVVAGELYLDETGRGTYFLAPDFGRDEADILAETFLAHAVTKRPDQPCLTCTGDAPCLLVYALRSDAPIRGLALWWYPRVLTDLAGENVVRAEYSTDGLRYEPLGELRSGGDFFWYGGRMRQERRVRLNAPTQVVYLRFSLSGGGAELWSAPDLPMRVEVDLGPTGFSGLAAQGGTTELQGREPPLDVYFSDKPLPGWLDILPVE